MISVTPSPAWRDAAGRFARLDAGDTVGRQLLTDSGALTARLRNATPIKTGAAASSWQSTYLPSSKQLRISNQMGYTRFLITGTGTKYRPLPAGGFTQTSYIGTGRPRNGGMAPAPALRAVIEQIPAEMQGTLHQAGVTVLQAMKGTV